MFQERTIEKIYYAVTEQRPEEPEGQLLHYLIKDRERNLARASVRQRDEFKEGKEAILNYKLKGSIGGLHLLEVKPLTGRHHQIRVQL
jgi:23S rRNA pseudouridine1911/1915/1917 synthase